MWRIKGWIEEWEKEMHKKNDDLYNTMFVDKYEDADLTLTHFMPITMILNVDENYKGWVWSRGGCWIIFGVSDVEWVEDENLPSFLAISLIQLTQQREGIVV